MNLSWSDPGGAPGGNNPGGQPRGADCTMAQAAADHAVPLDHISFKGSLDALRQFSHAMAKAKSEKKRRILWCELLRTLAADRLPSRPGRR